MKRGANLDFIPRPEQRQSGFTLVEVLMTFAVCVLALVSILFANGRVGNANDVAFQRIVAVQDAHRTVERMRETATYSFFPNNVMTAFPAGQPVAGFQNLNNQQVTVAYGGATDPLDVTVTVAWTDLNGRAQQYQLHTLMTQRE